MAESMTGTGRRFLVVHAHPLADSLSAALRDAVIEGLDAAGHEADLADLYADGFDPRLTAQERAGMVAPGYVPPPEVVGYCERLAAADGLVLVFPQWWYGMPAVLKGFVDRAFAPGRAFLPDRAAGRLRPGLSRLRSCHVVTTANSPRWIVELYMGNPVRRQIRKGIVGVCAGRVSFRMLSLHGLDKPRRQACERFVAKVRAEFARL